MFYGNSNVQLGGYLLKINDQNFTLMCGFEHTVSLLFNYFSKTPVVNQMVRSHNVINNLFRYGIYHKPHFIFK